MNNSDLWNLSEFVNKESFFQSHLKSVGIQKTKYMERYQKNIMGSRRSNLYTNLIMSFYLLTFAAIPVIALIHLPQIIINSSNINNEIFSNSFIFGTYFLFNFIYFFLIGFLPMMEFLQGKTFRYLRTLPLTSKDIERITIFTIIRMNGIQICVILFSLPIAILIFFKNITLSMVFLVVNIVNAIFIFYLLLIVSNFLSKKVFNNPNGSKFLSAVRILISFLYIISILAISFIYQLIPIMTDSSFLNSLGINNALNVNIVSSLILFPLSSGFIISIVALPTNLISTTIIGSSIIGVVLFLLLSLYLLRKGNKILSNLVYEESADTIIQKRAYVDPEKIKIKVNGPKVAYIKRILIMTTREQGKLVMFILPIFIGIFFAFSFNNSSTESISLNPFIGLFFYISFIPYILNNALSESEEGLGGLLSILPIKNRDIYRSKQYIIATISFLAIICYIAVIWYDRANLSLYTDSIIKLIFLAILEPALYLLLFSILFGKINGKYTTFKVNTDNSLMKYVISVGSEFVLMAIVFLISLPNVLYLIGLNIGFLLILEIIVRIFIK